MAAEIALPLHAQGLLVGEYQIKAAFLYNFAKFVEWPPEAFSDAKSPIVIAILGEDPFDPSLEEIIAGKTVQGRPLVVKHWKNLDGSWQCHILFVSASARGFLGDIFQKTGLSNVLTVGEMEGFAQRGGMINFILFENKVRFEINHKAAESAGLKISSKLLSLARKVWE